MSDFWVMLFGIVVGWTFASIVWAIALCWKVNKLNPTMRKVLIDFLREDSQ